MKKFDDSGLRTQMTDLRQREEENLMQSLAVQYGYEYINLRGYTINPEALIKVPEAQARAGQVIAFELNRHLLSVAVHAPREPQTKQVLEWLQAQGFELRIYLCSLASIEHGYARYADQKNTTATKRGILDIIPEDILKSVQSITSPRDVSTAFIKIRTANGARRISETLELMFAGALALKASDIHIEPEETAIRLRYRIDGVLLDIFDLDNHIYGRMMSRLKLLSGMVLNQTIEAQDGRFEFNLGERTIEVRSSVIPGANGESIVMRLLDPSVASFNMDKLQLNPFLAKVMDEQLKRPNGLIVTTGPTGSGKTTALYAFLQAVHRPDKKIITIENPVEYKLDGIVQTQTSPDYTFSSGLRAILRQDPDIIMIGEIRDREVAETAIHAAQTGHLVFTTLHTNSAVGGFPRLIDLGVDPRIIGSAVNIMLGERLVRVLCDECKVQYEASPAEVEKITSILATYPDGYSIPSPLILHKANGCVSCSNTGFKGRVGVFEAIVVDNAVEEAIIRDPREHIILEAATKQKIPTIAQDGVTKVLNGITSLAELERVVDLSRTKGREVDAQTATSPTPEDDFLAHVV